MHRIVKALWLALAARLHLRVKHAPVDYLPRQGVAKLCTTDGFRIGWCLVHSRFARLDARRMRADWPTKTAHEDAA